MAKTTTGWLPNQFPQLAHPFPPADIVATLGKNDQKISIVLSLMLVVVR